MGTIINNGTTVAATNLSASIVYQLWNDSRPDSILNKNGIGVWFKAISEFRAGVQNTSGQLMASFNINMAQLGQIYAWLGNWQQNIVGPFILEQAEVATFDELSYLQWGTASVLGSVSLQFFQPTLQVKPGMKLMT